MANSGAKFVSANLNKSYGQQHQPSHYTHHSAFSGSSSSYGQGGTGARGRPGSGGTGMVLLSRNRGTQKAGPKLSVPPPLNLPSLRKEHERFDLSGPGGGLGGGIGPGNGPRPTSSGLGWTKPVAATASSEKNESSADVHGADGMNATDGLSRGSGSYLPISAQSDEFRVVRSGYPGAFPPSAEKITVLRGEDFPSLQAARPVSSGTSQKQKDALNQRQKQAVSEETSEDKRDSYHSSLLADIRQQGQSSRSTVVNSSLENGGEGHRMGSLRMADHARKQDDYFPGPLPLVQFNPRSDWADDERDTGHEFAERGREVGGSKVEHYWDRDFDLPRPTVLMQKPVRNQNHWSQRDNKAGNVLSSEVFKPDLYNRDLRTTSREGREVNKWRTSPLPKNGLNSQEVGNDRYVGGARTDGLNNDVKDNKYITPHFGDTGRDGSVMVNRDSSFGRKDVVHVPEVRQQSNNSMELINNRGAERNNRDRYGAEQSNRYRGDNFRNNALAKSPFASSGKVPPVIDVKLTLGREKHAFSKGDRLFTEDPFSNDFGTTGFDERELFSRDLVGAIKRKKDVAKPTDFHDPVRESFEAELERVQKMQELERQRIIEEQERALEQARREEEERLRRIREEEERQRRLEEEAREAAWREEQERLEAIRKAEEQRLAREEEKKRTLMEEERRKQAAKEKLLELEARMAKRQSETSNVDTSTSNVIVHDKVDAGVKEKDSSRTVDLDNWEDSDRMGDKTMTTELFDSSAYDRPDISSTPYLPEEVASSFSDRGKSVNSWKMDMFENVSTLPFPAQDQEIGRNSPRRDTFGGGRTVPRKDFHGGSGYMNSRAHSKAGSQDPFFDDFGHQKDHRWNLPGDVDLYSKNREINSNFHDNLADKYGDNGLGQGHSRSSTRSPYPEQLYMNSEADELYPYGRSRHSMKQPRVLPPPLASSQRTFRGVNEHPGPSAVLDNGIHYAYRARSESTRQTGYYGGNQEALEASSLVELRQENTPNEDQKLKDISSRCDSQSSLSVSSPPNSPPHLSNDELDESGDSPVISIGAEGKKNQLSAIDSVILNDRSGNDTMLIAPSSTSAGEDEEWSPENDDELQQQEEYDEDEDGYQDEDEVRGGYDRNLDLDPKIEDLHLEERDSSHILDNVVLGFDDGVEVVIPSDDFARNSGTKERTFGISGNHVHIVEEQGAIDRVPDDEQSFLPADDSFGTSKDSFSRKVQETDKVLPAATVQPINAPYALDTSDFLYVDASVNSGLPAQQPISASGDVTSAAGEINLSSVASAGTQPEVPVKLQFGLFSGPSLIPSPIPAIQIGSIQMPLHIHPPVGPSLTHLHPSQPPIFQFGQLRYASPISQGILPMPHQSMSFVQPNMQAHYNLKQNVGGSVPNQPAEDAPRHAVKVEVTSLGVNKQSSLVSGQPEQSRGNLPGELGSVLAEDSSEGDFLSHSISSVVSGACDDKIKLESVSPSVEKGRRDSVSNNYLSSSKENGSVSQLQHVKPSSKYVSGEKIFSRTRHQGIGGSRGRRYAYAVKNSNARSSFLAPDTNTDSSGFQRKPRRTVQQTEIRARENELNQEPVATVNNRGSVDKSNYKSRAVGIIARGGSKRGTISNRPSNQRVEPESSVSGNTSSQELNSSYRIGKESVKDMSMKKQNNPPPGKSNFKRNASEEDVDAPLQSGVVRVYTQPGIEAPSDEDDFIEVRSKRQMLIDRREQREREIKAKSRVTKLLPKSRAPRQSVVVSTSPNKLSTPLARQSSTNSPLDFVASEGKSLSDNEVAAGTTEVSQPLAPIGTPALNAETLSETPSHAITSVQTELVSVVSNKSGNDLETAKMFENKNKVLDNFQLAASTWSTAGLNRQVMALTQTQLEEAMKPARYDSEISVECHSSTVSDSVLPSSSVLTKDKSLSSGASPINSLLAGEKIQFGAVTSPTVLPPSGRVVSHGIGAPGSNRPDIQMSRNLSAAEKDNSLFYEKEKHPSDSCVTLQDSEAEAEAAASAIAVAAISSDEIVAHGLGSVGFSDAKNFRGSDIGGIIAAVSEDQQLVNHSRCEESLSVSLPADLSVETTPISLWPPMSSSPSSTPQMLSRFPAGPPSHFPFYEMNPMLGGPIFAFGPCENSSGTQSQPQNSTASSSGPPGTWQQCHSSLDSIYGPPAGYTGPFISPPGGIPGLQGPPHMVVYNHFAPVGQYGQVGLSFMGTTYIPSSKQSDWKQNPTSSAMHVGEGEMSSMNTTSTQRNASNMAAPVQHLAPGSPLLPIASPLPMFDASPFQSAPDLSFQVRWPHLPASPLHSLPLSLPLQQQADVVLPSQVGRGHSIDQPLNFNRFSESRISTPLENDPSFSVAADTAIAKFPAELGLVGTLRSINSGTSAQIGIDQSSSGSSTAESGKTNILKNGIDKNGKHQSTNYLKAQPFPQKNSSTRQSNSSGYIYQRGGGMSQRNNAGNECSYRRMGFQGRNQSSGAEKFGLGSKMKQIYVAKQTKSGSSNAAV
ncbi:Hypothetical predicted protein [Olea europaea subsp. europaea]|uniref:Uncharacterized protein n=1 Tax=Olea europaea subsp. europaea TaxID=158383 RepID=A0A8S0SVR7_OLEEU|nr:Hypothetical predicted protein [Olea europaea subsp. europaea]